MTFSLIAAGTKEQVRRQLQTQLVKHAEWNNDPKQPQAVIDLIEHHLDGSDYPGGVYVEASGHHDQYSGSLHVNIKPLNIPAEPAADGAGA